MPYSAQALYRIADIRAVERYAIEQLGIPGWQLMQRAGAAAFEWLQRHWPAVRRVHVFCGGGNNAGDGYVLAALALQAGFGVEVYAVADPDGLKGDALTAFRAFELAGGRLRAFEPNRISGDGVVVDALFGTGLNRPPADHYIRAIAAINASRLPVLALDIPSGLQADSGQALGAAVKAQATMTFIGLKCGLYTGMAADYCGEIVCDDLDLPEQIFQQISTTAELLAKQPLATRARTAHKGRCGHVLLVGGNLGYSGAIRLAGEAALRSGAGLATIASRPEHAALLNLGRPELMCHGVESAELLAALISKASCVVIGPGLGQDDWAKTLLQTVLDSGIACVVDADALNLLAAIGGKRQNWILTPHPGEAARLLQCSTAKIAGDRYRAVTELQARYGGVCVLKGAGSLIADGRSIFVNTTGNPGMASGGMGDVLAGMTGALLAQGLEPVEAAKLAIYVHGEAADHVAVQSGERGLLASDLFPKIRELLN